MRSKVVFVLLLALILVSAKTHLKKNSKSHQSGWATDNNNSSQTGNGWGAGGNSSSTGNDQEHHNDSSSTGDSWGNHDESSSTGDSWGNQEETQEFDPANQEHVNEFQEQADNEYVSSIGNLNEFEQTYLAHNINSDCFSGMQREEVELFLFQGYVRYLTDLYYQLQYQKWWDEYYAQWQAYYEQQYYYEEQHPTEDNYTTSNDSYYTESEQYNDTEHYDESHHDDTKFNESLLYNYIEEDFVPEEETIQEIDNDFADITQTETEGYHGQLFELVQLRNKLKNKNHQDQEYNEALTFFKLGYMAGFIDGFNDYDQAAREFVHLSFYDQQLFGTYLYQVSGHLEAQGCRTEYQEVTYN